MVKKLKVSVIIVNYNTIRHLVPCLNSIYSQTRNIDFEVIVVDNNSQDESVKVLEESFTTIHLIRSEKNLGFGSANNVGANQAKGKYLLFLNPDTLLENNALKCFYDWMETYNQKEDYGAIGPFLLDENRVFVTPFDRLPRMTTLIRNEFSFITNWLHKKEKIEIFEKDVEHICGAAIFLPKRLFETLGGFDPQFFLYYEETDLLYRIQKKGLKVRKITTPEIIHLEGKSFQENNAKRILLEDSKFKYFRKHYRGWKVSVFKYIYLMLRILKSINRKYSLSDNIRYFSSIFKA